MVENGKRLVVFLDDEENVLSSLKRLLRGQDYEVYATLNYEDALKFMAENSVHVVVSDYKMPDITGIDFLEKVKKLFPEVIRILFTGYLDVKVAEDAINKAGVYRFLNKPWSEEDLKLAIKQGLERFSLIEHNKVLVEETKKKNDELLASNTKLQNMYEAQREFSSTVSHELRTPLASIKMAIDIIESETPGKLTADQRNFLGKAKSNVDRLNRLINDILDLTKMESGKIRLNIAENDLKEEIKKVVDCHIFVAEKKGLFLKTEFDEAMSKVYFDVDKINQVLNNLIGNAIKFTEAGGITVKTISHAQQNHVEVRIEDTGKGIAPEDISKLFQKFQQLGGGASHVGGTGLGLAICKTIVEFHGGKIWAESQVGKGTSFCFIIPIEERRTR